MLRYLRIAWSVTWGIACLLLIVLWVRSYWRTDHATYQYSVSDSFHVMTTQGTVLFLYGANSLELTTLDYVQWWQGIQIWPLTLWFSVMAAAPWLPWHFSLRTLLIVMTLVAIVLGAIVFSMQ
jgi:hypothetical protein